MLLKNPQWKKGLERGELLVGTLDTFLIWRWTDGKHHMTDVSMAARTLLMDIHQQQWSQELCDLFAIPLKILPAIKPSTSMNLALSNGLLLQASLGDQSAALVASIGDDSEAALVNLGTGGFVIRYLNVNPKFAEGYLRTLVYQDISHPARIAIEGTLNSIASGLAPYPVADCEPENLAAQQDIFCLAEPSGLGAPYFRADLGLQFSKPVSHLTQTQIGCLLLEAIVFRVSRMLEDFHRDAVLKRVYLSGGLSELISLQQRIAACVPQEVFRLQQKDASLLGAALLATDNRHVNLCTALKIEVMPDRSALREKYLRWKRWLDSLCAVS